MFNKNLPAKITYVISFFSDKERFIEITQQQYDTIKNEMNDSRFIRVNGEMLNVADIKSVEQRIVEPPAYMTIGNKKFYSDEEVEAWMNGDREE